MKKLVIFAATTMMAAGFGVTASVAADVSDVTAQFSTEAFDDVNDVWLRNMVNNYQECGRYGRSPTRRIDLLVNQYSALREAIGSGNAQAEQAAVTKLAAYANKNERFSTCWKQISRREGVSKEFTKSLASLTN